MKLFIEIEISASEFALAAELLKVLRLMTEHVKTRDNAKVFAELIARLEDEAQLDAVASEVSAYLSMAPLGPQADAVCDDLLSAFTSVVFARQQGVVPFMALLPRLPEPARTKMRDALIPQVLKHLTMKRSIDADRMQFFAQAEAFAAFVSFDFVSITGAVSTIITLLRKPENRSAAITMLGKTVELCLQQLTEKCEAGRLLELSAVLRGITDPAFRYDKEYIQESMGWTQGGEPDMTGEVSAAPVAQPSRLQAVKSYMGHESTIFAMCYDETQGQLVSGGKDGSLITWDTKGQIMQRLEMPRHYACSMDLHAGSSALFVCGVAKEGVSGGGVGGRGGAVAPPSISMYQPVPHGYAECGTLSKTSAKLISCIKVLGQGREHTFVTGETLHAGRDGSSLNNNTTRLDERICLYDMASLANFATLQPLRQYTEHEDLITCMSLYPPDKSIFLSGSRDHTVRVWDCRMQHSVGMFGMMSKLGKVQSHDAMVTCLDALDANLILSASMDAHVLGWDFRTLSQGGSAPVSATKVDNSAVLKVAIRPGGQMAAVSTLQGLYSLNFLGTEHGVIRAGRFKEWEVHVGRYHDLKWARAGSVLYAAGDDHRVDIYQAL